jgi:hypothetical protein
MKTEEEAEIVKMNKIIEKTEVEVKNVNTSSWLSGEKLYVDPDALGGLTNIKPSVNLFKTPEDYDNALRFEYDLEEFDMFTFPDGDTISYMVNPEQEALTVYEFDGMEFYEIGESLEALIDEIKADEIYRKELE